MPFAKANGLTAPMTDGDGYWLNPTTRASVRVVRHELTMCNSAELERLGVTADVIAAAQGISPYGRKGEQTLRMLGVQSGLVRVRDHGDFITMQFAAAPNAEAGILQFVLEFFASAQLWRPWVKVGNFQTGEEAVLSWEEFEARSKPS